MDKNQFAQLEEILVKYLKKEIDNDTLMCIGEEIESKILPLMLFLAKKD